MNEPLTIKSAALLKNGVQMPMLGLGVWQTEGKETEQAVGWALEAGYRMIDTAAFYRNETEVGNAIRASGIPRGELFITTKIWPTSYFRAENAFKESLEKLGLDYVDLYLIHWPFLGKKHAWGVLEDMYRQGRARAIGVSNHSVSELEEMSRYAQQAPLVNQVEYHPMVNRAELLKYSKERGIITEGYSPLARGKHFGDPVIVDVAKKTGKSPAQVMIRWALQHGVPVIPKSIVLERIVENASVFDFEISAEDMRRLDALGV